MRLKNISLARRMVPSVSFWICTDYNIQYTDAGPMVFISIFVRAIAIETFDFGLVLLRNKHLLCAMHIEFIAFITIQINSGQLYFILHTHICNSLQQHLSFN